MDLLRKAVLPFVVFVTGACVLVIEITATRILSPYYGNTIFTVSSVIGIILAALSAGYYAGGKLADRRSTEIWFYGIILAGGLSVFALYLSSIFLLPFLSSRFSITSGPLVSSLALFFLPGFLLGMLSPFAIKLQAIRLPAEGIGSISGGIFFWSTLGSIAGSLSAGFVLIPVFGIDRIINGVGAVLVVLGILPIIRILGFKKLIVFAVIFISGIFFMATEFKKTMIGNVVYGADGVYEKITVYDGQYKGRSARFFMQDRSSSGAMFLDSDDLVYDYTKYYSLYKMSGSEIKEALVIGGGAYSIPKILFAELPEVNISVAEIEPSLFEIGKKYFRVPDSPRLKNYIEDGRHLLSGNDKKYDLMFSDVYYSLFSIPSHFTTEEFFKLAKSRLNKDGVFIANFIGTLSRQQPSFLFSEMKTFQAAFPNSYFFAVKSLSSSEPQNIIFFGYNSDIQPNVHAVYSEAFFANFINLNRFDLSSHQKLTDNFAPTDYLISKVLQHKSLLNNQILDGNEMLAVIRQQLSYGPRFLSAKGHEKMQSFLDAELRALSNGHFRFQGWTHKASDGAENNLMNFFISLPSRDNNQSKRIILGTHYDSKKFADRDSVNPKLPVPGANDSASGVAVLLEIARYLANTDNRPEVGVDIVFFDGEEGEENKGSETGEWKPLGSAVFTDDIEQFYPKEKPVLGIVLDMVCDKNLNIFQEKSSKERAGSQADAFWNIAKTINPNAFISQVNAEIRDDHTILNNAGIPSFLVIDTDYPYFHTTADTIDKCSAESLETVGNALLKYIYTLK